MVSSQESLPKSISSEFACKEKCQVGCTSQLSAFVEMPSYQHIPRKPCLADVFAAKQNSGSKKLEAQCVHVPGNICSFTSAMGTVYEDVGGSEPMKRRAFDRFPQHPHKRARQADCCWQVSEFSPPRTVHLEPLLSALGSDESRGDEDCFHLEPSGNTSAGMSGLPPVSCNFVWKEHNPVSKYASPSSTVDRGQSSRFSQLDDDSRSIFDYYPRKHVAVGPDRQAEIPTWRPRSTRRPSKGYAPGAVFQQMTEDNNEKFIGRCIVPRSDVVKPALDDPAAHLSEFVVCSCPDEGSIRCVKQHVNEAREKFKRTVGLTTFAELGFYDMGEYVAQKWTEQEELLFLKVVASNPASLGRNFWNYLPLVFPSKSSKELISYYFNVFMLRKRAEQNRFDPTHVDSDNDEWQESEEEVDAEEVYESDSVVETPGYQDDDDSHDEDDLHEDDEEYGDDDDDQDASGEDRFEEHDGIPMSQLMEQKSAFLPRMPCCEVNAAHSEDLDIQDDSCTSYEVHHIGVNAAPDPATGAGKDHIGDGGLSGAMDSGCFASPDAKPWDRSYFSAAQKSVDFLPTCHVIEEVLGKESADDDESDA